MEKPEVQFTQILKAGISTTVPTQHTQQQDEGSVVSSNTSIQIVHLHSKLAWYQDEASSFGD
jgi:hypothetical protein